MNTRFKTLDSPVGQLTLIARKACLVAILWEAEGDNKAKYEPMEEDNQWPILLTAQQQLSEYFAGQRSEFDLALDFVGTNFQTQVWHALLTIPFGQTWTYGQIAAQIGRPQAVRAVGAANGRNPLPIVIPCHRVIGANGSLTGFAGGVQVKEKLLALEGRVFGAGTELSRKLLPSQTCGLRHSPLKKSQKSSQSSWWALSDLSIEPND